MNDPSVAKMRDRLHALKLDDPADLKIFVNDRDTFIRALEGVRACAYDDATGQKIESGKPVQGNVTVGVGFNMETSDACTTWTALFGSSLSFDKVKAGQLCLTDAQINQLLHHSLGERESDLRDKIYDKGHWERLFPNERLAIESAYFNAPTLVNKKTHFYAHICTYLDHGSSDDLKAAVFELRHRSNAKKMRGLENRRRMEAIMLDTTLCHTA